VLYAVSTGWLHGFRTVAAVPAVAATLAGLATHRMAFGINSLLVLVIVRHTDTPQVAVAGLGTAVIFLSATGLGAFLANIITPAVVRRWGRYASVNGALLAAAAIQFAAVSLHLPLMVACGFLLGTAGQVVKLCVDNAMQVDVDDALRGHMFAVQDSLFWVSFIAAIALAAAVIPDNGYAPGLVITGSAFYLLGLAAHAFIGRNAPRDAR